MNKMALNSISRLVLGLCRRLRAYRLSPVLTLSCVEKLKRKWCLILTPCSQPLTFPGSQKRGNSSGVPVCPCYRALIQAFQHQCLQLKKCYTEILTLLDPGFTKSRSAEMSPTQSFLALRLTAPLSARAIVCPTSSRAGLEGKRRVSGNSCVCW